MGSRAGTRGGFVPSALVAAFGIVSDSPQDLVDHSRGLAGYFEASIEFLGLPPEDCDQADGIVL